MTFDMKLTDHCDISCSVIFLYILEIINMTVIDTLNDPFIYGPCREITCPRGVGQS